MKSKKMRERRSVRAAVHRVDVVVDTDEGQRVVKKLRGERGEVEEGRNTDAIQLVIFVPPCPKAQ
jgi:hypothetical protein